METIIDQIYDNGNALLDYLNERREISLSNEGNINFRKNILLSVASFFEKELTDIIIEFAKIHSRDNGMIVSLIHNKGVNRQYHTYFDWNGNNANSFFGLFGDDFSRRMKDRVKANDELNEAIKSFIELGRDRNILVHQNYASQDIQKTPLEIYEKYKQASLFIQTIKDELLGHID